MRATNRVAPRLRVVNAEPEAQIVNPEPCRCCHGHDLVAGELVISRSRDGVVLKRLRAVPGGFAEVAS